MTARVVTPRADLASKTGQRGAGHIPEGISAFADWQGLFTGTTPLLPAHLLDNDDPVALCEMITTGWPTDQGIPEDISGGP